MKGDVLRQLPPKREAIVAVELSTTQKQVGGWRVWQVGGWVVGGQVCWQRGVEASLGVL